MFVLSQALKLEGTISFVSEIPLHVTGENTEGRSSSSAELALETSLRIS